MSARALSRVLLAAIASAIVLSTLQLIGPVPSADAAPRPPLGLAKHRPSQNPIYLPSVRAHKVVFGSLTLHGWSLSRYAIIGEPITVTLEMTAVTENERVEWMRWRSGDSCGGGPRWLDAQPWKPFLPRDSFTRTAPPNFVPVAVSAQFADETGQTSAIVCDQIWIEGHWPLPTSPAPPVGAHWSVH